MRPQPGSRRPRAARCWYETIPGNGANPKATIEILDNVAKELPALIRLGVGAAAGVAENLTATKGEYQRAGAKQIWLQYPYMDQAQVGLRGTDLELLWNVVSPLLHQRWNANVTIPAVDPALQPRIRKVSDELNELMFAPIVCARFAAAHGPKVCARDAAGKPLIVVTRAAYPDGGSPARRLNFSRTPRTASAIGPAWATLVRAKPNLGAPWPRIAYNGATSEKGGSGSDTARSRACRL